MNKTKWAQRLFAVVLILAWLGYAAVNLLSQTPALKAGYRRGWDLDSRIDNIKQVANGSFAYHDIFQDENGFKELLTNNEVIWVGGDLSIIKGKDGTLYYSNNFPYETYDYSTQALQLRSLKQAVEKKGGSMVFVNCPDLFIDGFSQDNLPTDSLPISNLNVRSNALLNALQGYGVNSMDARRILAQSDLNPSQYRYKTEPHWTTQAAFEVYLALLNWMEQQSEDIIFFAERNNYKQTLYSNAFSGQMGQRVGISYAGYDDFTLIEPNFETGFSLSYDKKSTAQPKQGDFASVLLDQHWMDQTNSYEYNMYNTYLTSLYSFRQIRNDLNPNGPKILVIGDTSMLPVASLLAMAAGDLHLLWPYSVPDMDGTAKTLLDYIEKNNFDHVIIGMSPGSMYEGGFNFLGGIEVPEANEIDVLETNG